MARFMLAAFVLCLQAHHNIAFVKAEGQPGCALELTLAIDVSGSINKRQFALQVEGLADALQSPDIVQAIQFYAPRSVWMTVVQWSGDVHQIRSVSWTEVSTADQMLAFAAEVRRQPRHYAIYSTAIGEALQFIGMPSERPPELCARKIIDVSGDGPSNEGTTPETIRDQLVESGFTVNALAILEKEPDLQTYYEKNVIGGQGAFVMTANRFSDYPQAIRHKLLRELNPVFSQKIKWNQIRSSYKRPAACTGLAMLLRSKGQSDLGF